MSWAAQRATIRLEDLAYALLGIFDINMPLLYGEGLRAFTRLQQEIMKKTNDDSIFAWGLDTDIDTQTENYLQPAPERGAVRSQHSLVFGHLPDRSPKDFENCGQVQIAGVSTTAFTATNAGLQIELPVLPLFPTSKVGKYDLDNWAKLSNTLIGWIGLLNCSPIGLSELTGIFLRSTLRSDESGGVVERAQLALSTPRSTVAIGLGLVAQSSMKKLVIVDGDNEELRPSSVFNPDRDSSFRIALTETEYFSSLDYDISAGESLDRPSHQRGTTSWEPRTKVLMVTCTDVWRGNTLHGFCSFCFRRSHKQGEWDFTVFARTSTTTADPIRGAVFTNQDKDVMFDNLADPNWVKDRCFLPEPQRGEYEVVTTMNSNVVFGVRIYHIIIDAVPRNETPQRVTDDRARLLPPRPSNRPSSRAIRDAVAR
ncbi:hypothetical protein EK21DRAFT_112764 [Setomelanomma holmii]|uniref:DUF8212 domain-containing protein n=1 Tax=Setomelanomma holmii TaxID=210430 RepID=A0A9P4H9K0_9PLEO|nr:hypothetical protein EK21DRAFT_112764 [Setomelanomma holmii]